MLLFLTFPFPSFPSFHSHCPSLPLPSPTLPWRPHLLKLTTGCGSTESSEVWSGLKCEPTKNVVHIWSQKHDAFCAAECSMFCSIYIQKVGQPASRRYIQAHASEYSRINKLMVALFLDSFVDVNWEKTIQIQLQWCLDSYKCYLFLKVLLTNCVSSKCSAHSRQLSYR